MLKNVLWIGFLMLALAAPGAAGKIGTLDEVLKPQMIKVFDDELFVVEGHNVFIYSLEDLSLKKKLGKKGEGPGEYKLDPSRTLIITVLPDSIVAESRYKVVFFSRLGQFTREIKKNNPFTLQTLPLGKNFLVHKITGESNDRAYFSLHIYDAGMKPIKELYRQKFFTYENKVFVMPDALNYCILDDKVYVEESPGGFVIEVFDSSGNKVRRIEKPFEKLEVPRAAKEKAYNDYINIPFLRRMRQENGEQWVKDFLKSRNIMYPDYYPAIRDIAADGGKLYVRTHVQKEGKEEYLVLDPSGKLLKRVYLPRAGEVDFLVKMQGDKKFYNIHNNKFYYLQLVESEDDEEWELHVQNID